MTGVTLPPALERRSARSWLSRLYETDTSRQRMLAMEGLRGLAILQVFFCHYEIVVLSRLSPAYQSAFHRIVVQLGASGVDLFFLLSGLLIYRAALKQDLRLTQFFARRVQRIYPTFLVAFLIYFVASVLLHQGERRVPESLPAGLRYVVLNLMLVPGIADIKPLIPAAWSLSYEFCFYICIPLLVLALRMRRWSRLQRCLLWSTVLVLHVSYVVALPDTLPVYTNQSNTFLRFTMFLAGMLVLEMMSSVRVSLWLTARKQTWLTALAAASAVAYIGLLRHDINTAHVPVIHNAVATTLVFSIYTSLALVTLGQTGLWKELFSLTWLRWLGNISYSFYLIHGIVLNVLVALCLHIAAVPKHPVISGVALLPIYFIVTFACATLLFTTVERPLSLNGGFPALRRRFQGRSS